MTLLFLFGSAASGGGGGPAAVLTRHGVQRLQLAVYDGPNGTMLADWSQIAVCEAAGENEHGPTALGLFIPMRGQSRIFRWYRALMGRWLELNEGPRRIWGGRIEDVAIVSGGLRVQAFGLWRLFSDPLYTALWSKTTYDEWREVLPAEIGGSVPKRFEFDTDNHLFITPEKGALHHGTVFFHCVYTAPDLGSRTIVALEFDYAQRCPTNWVGYAQKRTAFGSTTGIWSLNADNTLQTGSQALTFTGGDQVIFGLYRNAVSAAHPNETGDDYLEITNLRIKTTTASDVTADLIALDLAEVVDTLNPSWLGGTARVQSPGLDLTDELYEDARPAEILTRLAEQGDDDDPPRRWEVGVDVQGEMYLRPRGSGGRQWFVDIEADLELEQTLETLANSVYATYEDGDGRPRRTAASTDAASAVRYHVTRQEVVGADTTSATQATVTRDTALEAGSTVTPRTRITVLAIYNERGARRPLYELHASDTIIIRNLPPTLGLEADKISVLIVTEREYDPASNTLSVSPELPSTLLNVVIAGR